MCSLFFYSPMFYIKSLGIHRLYFPTQLGHLLDPCDNEFHAAVHRHNWGIVDTYRNPTMIQQIKAIHKSYRSVDESTIRSYFNRCGITGTEAPKDVLEKLYHEGVYPSKKFRNMHNYQLNTFIQWKWQGRKTVLSIFGDSFRKLFSQKRWSSLSFLVSKLTQNKFVYSKNKIFVVNQVFLRAYRCRAKKLAVSEVRKV